MGQVRYSVTLLNLLVTGIVLSFYCTAPVLGFPTSWAESFSIAQTIIPVFVGNIALAAVYVSQDSDAAGTSPIGSEKLRLLKLLVYGSMVVFFVVTLLASAVFWISSRGSLMATGSGMSLETLQTIVTASLSLNTATSNHLMARLFPQKQAEDGSQGNQ